MVNRDIDNKNIAVQILSAGHDEWPAILYQDQVLTYGELRYLVDQLACALISNTQVKGERIGLYADNVPFFVIGYLATIRAGLCCVPFPPATDEKTFKTIITTTGIHRLLVQKKYIPYALQWSKELTLEIWPEVEVTGPTGEHLCPALNRLGNMELLKSVSIVPDNDMAVIVFTSGSTGKPKGVMVTHENIACNTQDIINYMNLSYSDRAIIVLPLSYCFGASLLHIHLMKGASVLLCSSFMFPEKVLNEMENKSCTGLAGVPSTYQILLRKTTFAKRKFPSLRWMQQAGGKLATPFIRELRQAHPDVRLFIMYGQTEATARLSYLPPELLDNKLGSIGRGLQSTNIQVIKEDGIAVTPGSKEIGEIVASGKNITRGYWNDLDETKKFFRDGSLYTGDLATVDLDGYIFIVDRARDFIKSMGNRVSAQEIEEIIAANPEVVHTAVVGVPDDLWGESIVAYIVPRRINGLNEREIIAFCNERLPNYKVPNSIIITDRLPTNSSGKILKNELRSTTWLNRNSQINKGDS